MRRDSEVGRELAYISAFTVAELGEMLPRFTTSYRTPGLIPGCEWACDGDRHENADTEADARATMLAYLLENKLINAPQ